MHIALKHDFSNGLTPQITISKKQSDAALFIVRVHLFRYALAATAQYERNGLPFFSTIRTSENPALDSSLTTSICEYVVKMSLLRFKLLICLSSRNPIAIIPPGIITRTSLKSICLDPSKNTAYLLNTTY